MKIPSCPRNCKLQKKFLQKATAHAGRRRNAKARRPAKYKFNNKTFGGKVEL